MSETVKVIELVGNSQESWEDAAQNALEDATETLEHVRGFEVVSQTAKVEDGTIDRYKATIHVAFVLDR